MWLTAFIEVLRELRDFVLGKPQTVPTLALSTGSVTTKTSVDIDIPLALPDASPKRAPLHSSISFEVGETYSGTHESVVALRSVLKEQGLHIHEGALTTYEWLAYVFHNARHRLPWLALGMTPAGQWHQTLRGYPRVYIELEPKTGAIMEWGLDQVSGSLGRITSVAPDDTLVVEQMGVAAPGVFSAITLTKEAWREYRPVFITCY